MAFPILETERLRLVEIEQSYCQKIYEIFSLDEVTCYYGMNSFYGVWTSFTYDRIFFKKLL